MIKRNTMIWIEYFNILNILNIEFVYCEKKITKLICTFLLWIHIDKNISKNEDYLYVLVLYYPLDANNFGFNLLLYCGRAKRGHTLYFSDFSHISFYSHFPMFDYITSIKISFETAECIVISTDKIFRFCASKEFSQWIM